MDYPVIIRNGFPILGRVNARESITTFHHILSECKLDAFIKYKVGRYTFFTYATEFVLFLAVLENSVLHMG